MKKTELKLVTTQLGKQGKEAERKLIPIVAQAVELIKLALEEKGVDPSGHMFGENQFIFDELGTVSSGFSDDHITVVYDLGVDEKFKAVVARALQVMENVSFEVGGRYKNMYGNWHVDEQAYVVYAYELLTQNTDIEDQRSLIQLMQLNIDDLIKEGLDETTH